MKKPNILFITTDQQRWDTIAQAGYDHMITPQLDALAKHGRRFNFAYTPCPLCVPARASIMTGCFPRRNGVQGNALWLPNDNKSWPRMFTEAGYDTCSVGKMHCRPWNDSCGFSRRVIAEDKFSALGNLQDDYAKWLQERGHERPAFWRDPQYKQEYYEGHAALVWPWEEELHIDSYIGSNAVRELKNAAASGKPFCHWVSFNSPHAPIDPPQRYLDMYEERDIPPAHRRPYEPFDKPATRAWAGKVLQVILEFNCDVFLMDDEAVKKRKKYYYATITLVDHWIGQIIQTLKDEGLYDDTIIVFTSDHGDALGDNNLFEKTFFYEGMVRVPFVVHCPARFTPGTSDEFIGLADLGPTLLSLAGLPVPEGLDGRDITPLITDTGEWNPREAIFSEHYILGQSLTMCRTRDWKLVFEEEPTCCELYDLKNDPSESRNVYHNAENREIREELVARVKQWRSEGGSLFSEPPVGLRGDLEALLNRRSD